MDRCGVERMVVSLTQPGIQGIPDRAIAVDTAKRMNDDLVEHFLAAHPNRFAGFAAVALQDVRAAGDELERAVSQLGFKGALINGYSKLAIWIPPNTLISRRYGIFGPAWKHSAVPVYLHPRSPLPSQRRVYEGYPVLADCTVGVWRRNSRTYAPFDLERVV